MSSYFFFFKLTVLFYSRFNAAIGENRVSARQGRGYCASTWIIATLLNENKHLSPAV